MTRKDYKLIAQTMKDSKPLEDCIARGGMLVVRHFSIDQWKMMVSAMADTLAKDNARFVRAKFLAECGME